MIGRWVTDVNKWHLKTICFGFIALHGIFQGYCRGIPNELIEYHQKLDHWASSQTFQWSAQVTDKLSEVKLNTSRHQEAASQNKNSPMISRYHIYANVMRKGDQTLLKGSMPIFSNPSPTEKSIELARTRSYMVYFEQNSALFYDYSESSDQSLAPSTPKSPYPPAIVWKCPDSCLNYAHPKEVLIRPELFVFLSCKYPFTILGCEWKVLSENSDQIILECFNSPGLLYSRIRATFSKKHSGALLRIQLFSGDRETKVPTVLWESMRFRRENGFWIPAKVHTVIRVGIKNPISVTEYEWKLEKIESTSQTELDIPKGAEIYDYRLVSNLFTNELMWRHMNEGVSYGWTGSLPSETELRKMALEQGKLPPNPQGSRATWVLLIPAFILLGLAVYFYKSMQKRAV